MELERSTRARNGLPESRPYVYNGTGEDIYRGVTGYLEAADIGPGPEWYRERAAEDGDELAELDAARDRYQEAQAILNAPPAPVPAAPLRPAARCRRCGYLPGAPGHQVTCGRARTEARRADDG